jgi:hypothetical protein
METSSAHALERPANASQAVASALNPQKYHGLPTLSTKIPGEVGGYPTSKMHEAR